MIIMTVLKISRQQAYKQCQHIHPQVKCFSIFAKDLNKFIFHHFSKKIQRKHVEDQVSDIGMYEPATEEPVPLISFANSRRIKDQVIDYFLVAESAHRNNARNN